MGGIKGKNLGTAYHIYDLRREKLTAEYRNPKSSTCIYTKPLDPNYGEKKKKHPQQERLSMEDTDFYVFENRRGWNKRWMRFAKTALALSISAEEFEKYFVNNDYDGFREVLRREARSKMWDMREWNNLWTRLDKKARKLNISEDVIEDYFEIDDREGFKEILRQRETEPPPAGSRWVLSAAKAA